MSLPYFNDNVNICPVRTLSHYLQVTSVFREDSSCSKLFLTFKKPHKEATSQSISRWIKQVMKDSGIDISIFSSHSTRHAASSQALRVGISTDSILKAVGWSPNSSIFANHYNRPIHNDPQIDFARSIASS